MITIQMKYSTFGIYPENQGYTGSVITVFPDGFKTKATREKSPQNNHEAQSQGYSGPDAVWKSLVEHEYLHSLISELLYDRPSLVLETESGRKFHPSWLRYQEEAVVIGGQYLLNSKDNTSETWNVTWNLIKSAVQYPAESQVNYILTKCLRGIQDLWSQIEKDSK